MTFDEAIKIYNNFTEIMEAARLEFEEASIRYDVSFSRYETYRDMYVKHRTIENKEFLREQARYREAQKEFDIAFNKYQTFLDENPFPEIPDIEQLELKF